MFTGRILMLQMHCVVLIRLIEVNHSWVFWCRCAQSYPPNSHGKPIASHLVILITCSFFYAYFELKGFITPFNPSWQFNSSFQNFLFTTSLLPLLPQVCTFIATSLFKLHTDILTGHTLQAFILLNYKNDNHYY